MLYGTLRTIVKATTKDAVFEPHVRWLWKRARGIPIPLDNVRNEIFDRQGFEVMSRVLQPESSCIDIGCNVGAYLEKICELAPRGEHFAFEPIPELAQTLQDRFPGVRVHATALSDTTGSSDFAYLAKSPALSHLVPQPTRPRDAGGARIRVPVATLDSLIPAARRIAFVKLDVEGAEGPVLAGARRVINDSRPYLLFEHGAASSSRFGWTSAAIFDLLTLEYGLRVSRISDWLHRVRPLTRKQFVNPGACWYFLAHP